MGCQLSAVGGIQDLKSEIDQPLTPVDVVYELTRAYGPRSWFPRYDSMSDLIFTGLSQNPADVNSARAYESLMAHFEDWESMRQAEPERIAQSIQAGGLARVKAPRIKSILGAIYGELGGYDLSFLAELPLDEAKRWLLRLPGVGPKTAACVLCFALGRPALPVDTHVYRVARRLGLITPRTTPEEAHADLEQRLPPELVYSFHMNLIDHGRQVCHARRPRCEACVLSTRCPSSLAAAQASPAPDAQVC